MQLPAALQFLTEACAARDHIVRWQPPLDLGQAAIFDLDLPRVAKKVSADFSLALGRAIFPLGSFCRDDCVASAAYG